MTRWVVVLLGCSLAGCDISFGILHFDPPSDASADGERDAPLPASGCADGVRDGYLATETYPALAACVGGWSVMGLETGKIGGASCGSSGNAGAGSGCAAADLCAADWHICVNRAEVATNLNGVGCDDAIPVEGFFATNQPASGGTCAVSGADDLFGCGRGGMPTEKCGALTKTSGDGCDVLGSGWSCEESTSERTIVTKPGFTTGGVLCCRD